MPEPQESGPFANVQVPVAHRNGDRQSALFLLLMVLVIATTGLVYELVMAAVASYVLGDSVRQFSTVIGVYLSALGLGAYVSRFIGQDLELRFIDVELGAAIVGGLSAPLLFAAFSFTLAFQACLYSTVVCVGVQVGLELPLLMRILNYDLAFKELVSKALTFDYAGALVGSLGFSMVLMPRLGLVRSSLVCGMLNSLVALAATWVLAPGTRGRQSFRHARVRAFLVMVLLGASFAGAERLRTLSEGQLFGHVSISEQSEYQRIVVTEAAGETSLYLNGALQFSSVDERLYHEALVHPAMASSQARHTVFVGGGGDGLAVREVLRWPDVKRIVLVDIDPRITTLSSTRAALRKLNRDALADPRTQVINADAMQWLGATKDIFDVMILDFPDPSNYSVGKLFSTSMFRLALEHLKPRGAVSVQATSPHATRKAFWCVVTTLEAAGFTVSPYHAFVPSFGDWGFVLATHPNPEGTTRLPVALSAPFVSSETTRAMSVFPADTARVGVLAQTLESQRLVDYYLDEHRQPL